MHWRRVLLMSLACVAGNAFSAPAAKGRGVACGPGLGEGCNESRNLKDGGNSMTDRRRYGLAQIRNSSATWLAVDREECGDGYLCAHQGAYGCAKINAPSGTPMVCCSTGQPVSDCQHTSSPIHPLPFCPYGGATGPGCDRESVKTNSRNERRQAIRVN